MQEIAFHCDKCSTVPPEQGWLRHREHEETCGSGASAERRGDSGPSVRSMMSRCNDDSSSVAEIRWSGGPGNVSRARKKNIKKKDDDDEDEDERTKSEDEDEDEDEEERELMGVPVRRRGGRGGVAGGRGGIQGGRDEEEVIVLGGSRAEGDGRPNSKETYTTQTQTLGRGQGGGDGKENAV